MERLIWWIGIGRVGELVSLVDLVVQGGWRIGASFVWWILVDFGVIGGLVDGLIRGLADNSISGLVDKWVGLQRWIGGGFGEQAGVYQVP